MESETLEYYSNDLIDNIEVINYETNKNSKVYDLSKLNSLDKYDIFLSGATALIEINNYECKNDKELVIFRDSYASSLVPLMIENYSKITLIDTRYISSSLIGNYVEFNNQDILFMYSTMILNNSNLLK